MFVFILITSPSVAFGGLGLWVASLELFFDFASPLVFDWLLSLMVASALASEKTLEVIDAAEDVLPKDSERQLKVAEPAKALATGTMEELTEGWGRALAVAYAVFGQLAMAVFSVMLGREAFSAAGVVAFVATIGGAASAPLAMSMTPAAVSTTCDALLTALNAQRSRLLGDDVSVAKRIHLEDYLNSLNIR